MVLCCLTVDNFSREIKNFNEIRKLPDIILCLYQKLDTTQWHRQRSLQIKPKKPL